MPRWRYQPALPAGPALTLGDGLILLGITALLYAGVRLAFQAPPAVRGPAISLSLRALPWYALLSLGRMTAAYTLALAFSLTYGYAAARNATARALLLPLLDVLQSVPILSFLPVVLLSLSAVLPQNFAAELAAVTLIFTSQAWNMTFSFYQSLTTIPRELSEAAAVFRLHPWLRFKSLELPFAAMGLLWNSMMSWSGGWFFLMASEIFHVGARDFRLPGLGSYLQTAANQGNMTAVLWGLAALVTIIVALDQLVWRPLLAWSDKFKMTLTEGDEPPRSWWLETLRRSWLLRRFRAGVWRPLQERLDMSWRHGPDRPIPSLEAVGPKRLSRPLRLLAGAGLAALLYGGYRAALLLLTLPAAAWLAIGKGLLATAARVGAALLITLLWTIPLGVAIGLNRRLAAVLQPVVQVVASLPATALFPLLLLALLHTPVGLNGVAVALMLMGAQWYLLFNIIAGAAAIPQDLRYTTASMRLSRLDRWRALFLPALFPYLITGAITASGGAWNASVVAEHVMFGGRSYATVGIGALLAQATDAGDYALLLAGTLALVVTVVLLNRLCWRRLYLAAEQRYRLE